jgi:jasmonate ZIM domain-containing protein
MNGTLGLDVTAAISSVHLLIVVFQLWQAKELMMLASRASIPSPPIASHKLDSPISAPAKVNVPEVFPARQIVIQKPEPCVPHVTSTSSPIPIVPQVVTLSRSTSHCNTEACGSKPAVQSPVIAPITQATSSQPLATTSAAAVTPRGMVITCLQFPLDVY